MKIALVHDSLMEFGGSERVLAILLGMFPNASVFTAYFDPDLCRRSIPELRSHPIRASFLQGYPVQHHTSFVQSLAPAIWAGFDLSAYDLVISNADHLMSSFVRVPRGIHIAYIQSLPKNIFGLHKKTPLQYLYPYQALVRPMYRRQVRSIRHILANSRHSRSVFRRLLGVDADILYPPVALPPHPRPKKSGGYFITVSRIDPTKRLETAVIAANRMRAPLVIAGESNTPSYERYLKSIAGPTVTFTGYLPDKKISALYASATAFVFPSVSEDFGITPLEATAHGVPVVAYNGGGARETVIEGKTGTFYHRYTTDAVMDAMERVRRMHFSPAVMYAHAKAFGEARFKRELYLYVRRAVSSDPAGRGPLRVPILR